MSSELRRRVLAGLEMEIEFFGDTSEASRVLRPQGIIASISPRTPDRSLFNSVYAVDAEALAASIDSLAAAYEAAGVRAWTVWVNDDERAGAELLAARGHLLDGAPRSMALWLEDLRPSERPLPAGAELVEGEIAAIAAINDGAYGIEAAGWGAAVERAPGLPMAAAMVVIGGRAVCGAMVLESGGDACVTAVATLPEHRGKGLASAVLTKLLGDARDRGTLTGTLQASKAGAPVYERLGFIDVGFIEMWERRTVAP